MKLALYLYLALLIIQFIMLFMALSVRKKAGAYYLPMLILVAVHFVLDCVDSFVPGKPLRWVQVQDLKVFLSLLLIAWQAKQWHVFDQRPLSFKLFLGSCLAGWVTQQALLITGVTEFNAFVILACVGIVLLCIEALNRNMIQSRSAFLRNPIFLFCVAMIFYFMFYGLLELFTLIPYKFSEYTILSMGYLYITLGILTGIIYIRAILCIPPKDKYYSY